MTSPEKMNQENIFSKINQEYNVWEEITSESKYFNSVFTQDDTNDFSEFSQDPILNIDSN